MTEKYGNRNVPKMLAQINILRAAIRAEGTEAIQTAWDAVEEHIDYAYAPRDNRDALNVRKREHKLEK